MDRQNLSGQNIYFLLGTGQRLFPYIHKNKTRRVARLTHDRKVADTVPPPPPRPTNHARSHLRCVRIDPRMTPNPPFTGYVYTAVQKCASYIEHPPPVITYHTHSLVSPYPLLKGRTCPPPAPCHYPLLLRQCKLVMLVFFLIGTSFPEFIPFEVNGRLFIFSIFNKFDIV